MIFLLLWDQQLWIQGRRKCKLMLQTDRQSVRPSLPGIQVVGACVPFQQVALILIQCWRISTKPAGGDLRCTNNKGLAAYKLDGGRRTGTRLFLRMPKVCGKGVDTAECWGIHTLSFPSDCRWKIGRWRDRGIGGSPQHLLHGLCGCLAAILVTSSLMVTSSAQAHATCSRVKQPFQRCAP